ncbi:MAG: terminase small subunit [Sphaerochaetaceae bacterium]
MPRARNPNRDKAFELYKASKGEKPLVEIAEELGASPGTVRGWKNKDEWDAKVNGTFRKKQSKKTERSKRKAKQVSGEADEIVQSVTGKNELTNKEQLFCIYFVKTFNQTRSYMKAFGCSYQTAAVQAHRLLKQPKIVAEIEELKKIRLTKAFLKADDLWQRHMEIAFADITDFVEIQSWGMRLKEGEEIDGTLVTEIKNGKNGPSLKIMNRERSMKWLEDRMDLMTDVQRQEYELKKQRLELDQKRFNLQTDDDEEYGVVMLPEATEGEKG